MQLSKENKAMIMENIKDWEERAAGDDAVHEIGSWSMYSDRLHGRLCRTYRQHGRDLHCVGCPIAEVAGGKDCPGSPGRVLMAINHAAWVSQSGPSKDAQMRASQKTVEWLRKLL